MKRPLVAIFIMLFASLVAGQDSKTGANKKAKPDFSGTWQLDSYERSNGKSVEATNVVFVIVQHQEPEIRFIENNGRTDEQELIYYSDERGEENPSGKRKQRKPGARSHAVQRETGLKNQMGWGQTGLARAPEARGQWAHIQT